MSEYKKPPSISEVLKMNGRPDYSECRLTRGEAIRRHCLDCSGFSFKEVRECFDKGCPLYRYRMGYEVDPTEEVTTEVY